MNDYSFIPGGPRQRGASLIVVLLLLLIMTLLGLGVLRGVLLEERMSANMLDRGLGFQAAEAALREGEALAATEPTVPGSGCNGDGVCATPAAGDTDRWLDDGFTGWREAQAELGDLAVTPKFIIEYMGEAPTWTGCDRKIPVDDLCMRPRYRITAISADADRAQVLLQTNYLVQ